MGFKFLGIQHINFTPKEKTEPIQGYKVHFTDDTLGENSVGMMSFNSFFSYIKAAAVLGINSPIDMGRYYACVDKPCQVAFDRNGKVTGLSFDIPAAVATPPSAVVDDNDPFASVKPKKL